MNKVLIYAHFILSGYSSSLLTGQDTIPGIVITITNTTEQTTAHKAELPSLPCDNLVGKKLVACMSCLANNIFKKQFFSLNAYARKEYLLLLTRIQHRDLLQRFEEEQEWHNQYELLNPENRRFLPKTIDEQASLIKRAESISLSWKKLECFFSVQTNPCPPDFIDKTIEAEYQMLKKILLDKYASE